MKKISLFTTLLILMTLALTGCSETAPEPSGDGSNEQDNVTIEEDPVDETENNGNEADEVEVTEPDPVEPFDTDALIANLGDYVLRQVDMPNEYRAPPGEEVHWTNLNLIQTIGELEAKTYMDATGRLDGWSLALERVNKEELIPGRFESSIEVFETVEGAQLAISPEWFAAYQEQENAPEWIDEGCDFGEKCLIYFYRWEDPVSELMNLRYEVAYTYKNTLVWVMGRGLEIDVKVDYILEVASVLADKLEAAP